MENLLETYGDTPELTPISVVSDEPKESNVFQANQLEEIILIEAEQPKGLTKAKLKKYQLQTGIQKFFHQLPQGSSPVLCNLQILQLRKQTNLPCRNGRSGLPGETKQKTEGSSETKSDTIKQRIF